MKQQIRAYQYSQPKNGKLLTTKTTKQKRRVEIDNISPLFSIHGNSTIYYK